MVKKIVIFFLIFWGGVFSGPIFWIGLPLTMAGGFFLGHWLVVSKGGLIKNITVRRIKEVDGHGNVNILYDRTEGGRDEVEI